jgi:hypothetical protein
MLFENGMLLLDGECGEGGSRCRRVEVGLRGVPGTLPPFPAAEGAEAAPRTRARHSFSSSLSGMPRPRIPGGGRMPPNTGEGMPVPVNTRGGMVPVNTGGGKPACTHTAPHEKLTCILRLKCLPVASPTFLTGARPAAALRPQHHRCASAAHSLQVQGLGHSCRGQGVWCQGCLHCFS